MSEPCAAGRRVFVRSPDRAPWPTPEKPCPEPGEKTFRMVTPGGVFEFAEELCVFHDIEFRAHFFTHPGPFPEERA